jgi:HlyD family secretion protein
MRKPVLIAVFLVAVALVGAGLAAYSSRKETLLPVMEGSILPRSQTSRIAARAVGMVEAASEEIGVSSDITGRIAEILVEEGDRVEKGAALARLEPFVYASRVEAAKAAVAKARAGVKLLEAGARSEEIRAARNLLEESQASERLAKLAWDRSRKLFEAGLTPESEADAARKELDAAQSRAAAAGEELQIALHRTRVEELEAARADVAQREHELAVAEAELEKTVLRAPISGTIIRRKLRVGEAVSSFQVTPVVTMADMSQLRVRAEVDEIDIGKIRESQAVDIELLAHPARSFPGRVFRIGKAMGRKEIESNDPNERQDLRILEVLIDLEAPVELPLGLRVMASFLEGPRS